MIQIPWYVGALGAALMWGLYYPLIGFALKYVSLQTVLALSLLPVVVLAPFFYRPVVNDLQVLASLGWGTRAMILMLTVTGLAGTVFLIVAIGNKNATLAALVEISYPVFVVFFSWLMFREVHVTANIVAGAVLVFTGVVMIILSSR